MMPSSTPLHDPDQAVARADDGRGPADPDVPRPVYVYDVDDTTYEYDHPTITGAQIMQSANIPTTEGLIRILPDGTRETVDAHDEIHLVSGIQFKRRPRFKRG
jgi:hypothetical protein